MDIFSALTDTNEEALNRTTTSQSFDVRPRGEKICIITSAQILEYDRETFFRNVTNGLLHELREIPENLNADVVFDWTKLEEKVRILNSLWSLLTKNRIYCRERLNLFPKDDLIIFASYALYRTSIIDFDQEQQQVDFSTKIVWIKDIAKCLNETIQLLMLVCTESTPSDTNMYNEIDATKLREQLKLFEGNDLIFIVSYVGAMLRLLVLLRETSVTLKGAEPIPQIINLTYEIEVAFSYLSSVLLDPLHEVTVRNRIPAEAMKLFISGLQLLQPPITLPITRRINLRKDVPSDMCQGGLEILVAHCLALITQLQAPGTDPSFFESIISIPDLKDSLANLASLIWQTAETVLLRHPFCNSPVYCGESQLTANLLYILPELVSFHNPLLLDLPRGITIVFKLLSADEVKFLSKWCGGIDSRKLVLKDPRATSASYNCCFKTLEARQIIADRLHKMRRESGERFHGKDSIQEIEQSIALVKLVASFLNRYASVDENDDEQNPFLHQIVNIIQSHTSNHNERRIEANKIRNNLHNLMNFLNPLKDSRLITNQIKDLVLQFAENVLVEIKYITDP